MVKDIEDMSTREGGKGRGNAPAMEEGREEADGESARPAPLFIPRGLSAGG